MLVEYLSYQLLREWNWSRKVETQDNILSQICRAEIGEISERFASDYWNWGWKG